MNDELVSAALLGTARKQPALAHLDVSAAAERLSGDPAAVLLKAAALQHAFERGSVTGSPAAVPAPAADDVRSQLPALAAARVVELLTTRSPVLPEWFAVAHARGYRAPDVLVALLLGFARSATEFRADIVRLAGTRGQWVAARNPEWSELVRYLPDDAAPWTHGTARERRRWLTELRKTDPAAALGAMRTTWHTENVADRAAFLAVLETNPIPDDEPFLDAAAGDTRREVREVAERLLRRRPESAFVRRTAESHVRSWLRVEKVAGRTILRIRLSSEMASRFDAARPGGIVDNTARTLLSRTVAAIPLDFWTDTFGTPAGTIAAIVDDDWRSTVLAGLAESAIIRRSAAWADELSNHPGMEHVLPVAGEQAKTRYMVAQDATLLSARAPNPLAALGHPWPIPVVAHFLRLALERAGHAAAELRRTRANSPGDAEAALRLARAHMPLAAASAVRQAVERCPDQAWARALNEIGHTIDQRATMLEELQ